LLRVAVPAEAEVAARDVVVISGLRRLWAVGRICTMVEPIAANRCAVDRTCATGVRARVRDVYVR